VICANCGTENDAGAKFCNECGAALHSGCPTCGAANKPGAKFCSECGTPLNGEALATAAPPAPNRQAEPIAERRLVTVLFADLVGFTPFAEERDAEDVRDTLSRYFDLASEIVTRYGGTVEKFIGDAVMAVWGAPVAHENDAERAVRAGLELVDGVRSLGPNIQARAGLLTGEAAVTLGATNQGMVAGDLVNTASRLQSVAPAGSVLVGEATYRSASQAIVFDEAGDQLLKGKQSPVPAWRATRVVAERGGRNRSEGLEAPFVGRADELRLLKDLFHATGRENRTRLVSVMGPAGIGKSRLAWEFLKYIDGLVETVYWHSGRSPAYGEGISFWALGEMVRSRCGLAETDDEATTRQKVSETVERWIGDADERAWIEPALLTLLGIEAGAPSEQLFGAWRTFFERIAASGTVALVFEDMHFADSGLLDFIDHLLEWSRGVPLYIVTLARPDLLDKRADWGAGKRNFSSLYLDPLPDDQMRQLLAGLVPGLPDRASRAITERADGIPLYAVETVRMLLAEGRLREEGGVYVPVGDLASLAVPETLTALIASRLDRLDPADRAIVHDAAVLGQSFTPAGLAAVSGAAESEVEARLNELVRRELFTRQIDARSPEHGQYVFVQALIREVAYNTLAKRDRKVRHLAAARFFESLGTDELAGALASHYLAAHANAADGAESEALASQARIALRAAAERAANLGSYDHAVSFLEQALTVTPDPAEQAELLGRAGEAARTAARYDKAEELLRRAVELHEQIGDRTGAARASAALGEALLDGFRLEPALEVLSAGSRQFADLAPDPVVATLDAHFARALMMTNDYSAAIEVAERVLHSAEPRDLLPIAASALIVKGATLGGLGRKREGIGLIKVAEDLARELGLHQTLLGALITGGYHKGDLDLLAAMESYREGLVLARRLGLRNRMLMLVNNIGYTGFLIGDWDAALSELEAGLAEDLDYKDRLSLMSNALVIRACRGDPLGEAIAEMERLGAPITDPAWRLVIDDVEGNAGLAGGRLAESRAAWQHVVELEPTQAPEFLYRSSRGAIWAGDADSVRQDLAALDGTGIHGRVVDARRLTMQAGLTALEGRPAEAHALYREALRSWHELGCVWDGTLTGLDMVMLLDPNDAEVRKVADATRATLTRLGARPFVDQLDAALARSPTASRPSAPASAPAAVSSA
jgi:class 3 adenylate cyclase/tetratricopeptide (TPR) repeat protein